jgi:prepilin-type N-terminal cleavage/methylation domain-containing protein/prepilin-type processing-associated H-X9-DG protein
MTFHSPIKRHRGFTLLELIVVLAILGLVLALVIPAVRRDVRPVARRSQCMNNLKQIGLALHNYHDEYQAFPPAYTVDSDGKPLHSWRTLILPYMDQAPLYNRLDLTKPWDDPVNAEAFKTVVAGYHCPSDPGATDHTTYVAIVTDHSILRPSASMTLKDITDGSSNTVVVIEVDAAHAVPWMAPRDADESVALSFRDSSNKDSHQGGANALFGDGAVRFLGENLEAQVARALLTMDGGETLPDERYQ